METTSQPFLKASDVVHLRVAEAEAKRALEMLIAEGRVAPLREDPDIDPPAEDEAVSRCPRCSKAFSVKYDFCPYCQPPGDWLAAAVPMPPVIPQLAVEQEARTRPVDWQRDALAEWALYAAVLGFCVPLAAAFAALTLAGMAAFQRGAMHDKSWMCIYIAVILAVVQLGLAVLALYVWTTRALVG